jgi:hypothetical protein
MKIQYASDIHLEVMELDGDLASDEDFQMIIEPDAPVLVLAGDILTTKTRCASLFLDWVSRKFEHVFWIMGNHEYYSNVQIPMKEILAYYRSMCPQNVHILDNETYELDDVLFIGSTLWSYIPEEDRPEVHQYLNDYRMIYNSTHYKITPVETSFWHVNNVKFLQETLNQNPNKKCVIITHHCPINQGTSHPQFEGKVTNQAYASNITLENTENLKLWICGHTHHNFMIQRKNYLVTSNQFGYFGEHTGITYTFGHPVEI